MTNPSVRSKLIIVEGLTGSGKSTMAHFIARQLQYNSVPASWVHEGAAPHPFLIDLDTNVQRYIAEIRTNWGAYIDRIEASTQVHVIEASFFNNLLETLLAHQVSRSQIIQFADELLALSAPLNPTLIYLVQADVAQALERNFKRRGPGFRNFVIELATSTPLAQANGWEGYAGMVRYWQAFVALTDELYERFPSRKLKIDNTAGNWEVYNQQVVGLLSIPLIPEQSISPSEAQRLIGLYKDRERDREFIVRVVNGELTINLFLKVWTRLVRRAPNVFEAAGWPFEIRFEAADSSDGLVMTIEGQDVDYLPLVGIVAEQASA
jgi:dephospho-CoA kinase